MSCRLGCHTTQSIQIRRIVLVKFCCSRLNYYWFVFTFLTTSIPSTTVPNTTCFPSSQEVLTVVRKNWLPLVLRPALAMDKTPFSIETNIKLAATHSKFNTMRTWPGMLQREILVFELSTVNRFSTCTIPFGKVTSLTHEISDNAMECTALIPESLFTGAQGTEIFGRLWNDIWAKLNCSSNKKWFRQEKKTRRTENFRTKICKLLHKIIIYLNHNTTNRVSTSGDIHKNSWQRHFSRKKR